MSDQTNIGNRGGGGAEEVHETPVQDQGGTNKQGGVKEEEYILAVDIGTTTLRSLVFERSTMETVPLGDPKEEQELCRDAIELLYPRPGWVEIDPVALWERTLKVMQNAARLLAESGRGEGQTRKPACVALTAQRSTCLLWDRQSGEPVGNIITWQDTRTAEMCESLNKSFTLGMIHGATRLLYWCSSGQRWKAASNYRFAPVQVNVRIGWMLKNDEKAKRLAKARQLCWGGIDTWIIYKLTNGKMFVTDYSQISATGLFDPFKFSWNQFAIDMLNIPLHILPEIRDTAGDFGSVDAEFLGTPVPIRASCGDQMASFFAQCCFREGDINVTMGTGTFVDVNTGNRPLASDYHLYPVVAWRLQEKADSNSKKGSKKANSGAVFMAEGNSHCTGSLVEWLVNELGLCESVAASAQVASEEVSDSHGTYIVPGFSGVQVPHNDPSARGAIMGLTYGVKKAHVLRAGLEAIAFNVRSLVDIIRKDLGMKVRSIRLDGGVSKNDFINQTISNLTKLELERPKNLEMTAVGAALLAGWGMGWWPSYAQVEKMWSCGKKYSPMRQSAEKERGQEEQYEVWKMSVKRSLNFARHGAEGTGEGADVADI
eukprot:Nk52_evm12s159 gene=Nk52_evmTU12s159